MPTILNIDNVSKYFDRKIALKNISFQVESGSVFGLLGPNGAGKTTLIRILTQILLPDNGKVIFGDHELSMNDVYKIGYLPEERGLYKKMLIGEQLIYLARIKGLSYKEAKTRLQEWFEKFEIQDWWTKKVEELSKGMQQKVQFIAAIVHEPRFLILDEPLSGLDPVNSELINHEITNLKNKGATVLFSTHRMEQVEEICDSIVLINQGELILKGDLKSVKNRFKENIFEIGFEGVVDEKKIKNQNFEVVEKGNESFKLKSINSISPNEVLVYLLTQDIIITSFKEVLPSLNEIFIKSVTK